MGSLREAQTKNSKKDYFTRSLSSPTFIEINTLIFQEMFLSIFRKLFWKNLFLNNLIYLFIFLSKQEK